MENIDQPQKTKTDEARRIRFFFAVGLNIFLYGAYFYNLARQQLLTMVQKQGALESIKAVAVPGTAFLNNVGSLAILKSSLFYLALLGVMFVVFQVLSLWFRHPWKRAGFLSAGLIALLILTRNDRVSVSFSLVIGISFTTFYLLTLPCKLVLSLKELLFFLFLVFIISSSLYYGSKKKFFMKTRDLVLFNNSLGNKIISFYYSYSPLAASLVSLEKGVYEALIFHEGLDTEKFFYFGEGVFLSSNEAVRGAADFTISKEGEKLFISNRYGREISLESMDRKEIIAAIEKLFSMKGMWHLNKIALYFFPAGLFILLLTGIKHLTGRQIVFDVSSAGIASVLVLFIWIVILTGNDPPKGERLKSTLTPRDELSIAYYLYQKDEIPDAFLPVLRNMANSESPALRYWGAYYLGVSGNSKDSEALINLMKDPQLNVRYRAAQSLYSLLQEGSYRYLIAPLISDPSWYVRCKVLSVFLKAGTIPAPA